MATLETIARLQTEMVSTGADKVAADIRKVEAAQDSAAASGQGLASVTDTVAKRQLSGATALERMRKAVDDEYRSLSRLATTQGVFDRALQQGKISQEEHARLLSLAAAKYKIAKEANDNFAGSAASGSRLAAHEIQNLTFQMNDALTMLASGSSPFQVIATQGGQVYQVLAGSEGGVVGGVKAIGVGLLGLLTPITAATAAFAGLGAAALLSWNSWHDGQVQIATSLRGIGAASGSTVDSINAIVAASNRLGQGTVGDLRDFSTTLAATGRVGDDINAKFTGLSRNLTKALGGDAPAAAQTLAAALADPAKGIEDLNSRLGAFNAATVRQVQSLVAQNRVMEAQQLLYEGLKRNLADGADLTSSWSKAWDQAAAAASRYWAAAGKKVDQAILGGTDAEQLAAAQKELARLQEARQKVPLANVFGVNDAEITRLQKVISEITARMAEAASKSAEIRLNLESLKAMGEIRIALPEVDVAKALADRAKYLDGIKDDPKLLAAAGYTKEQAELAAKRQREAAASYLPDQDRAMRQAKLAGQATDARSPAERGAIAAEQKKLELAGALLAPEEKAAQIEQARANAAKEAGVALTDAARQRLQAAQDAIGATNAEIAGIGKTAAEAELLRLNWQTYAALRAEAAQNHTAIDTAELKRLQDLNAETVRRKDLLQQLQLSNDLQFERDQIGRSDVDQRVASRLRSAGQPLDMSGALAQQIRFNEQLSISRDLSYEFASGFARDLRSGTDAMTALGNALDRFADRLLDMAVNDLVNSAFSGLGKAGGSAAWSGANVTGLGAGGSSGEGFGGFLAGIGKMFGFAGGGYTGAGGKYEPAGVVHRGEYVFSAAATNRLGVGNLNALHSFGRGYADGGYVTAAAQTVPMGTLMAPSAPSISIGAPTITIAGNADSTTVEQLRTLLAENNREMMRQVRQEVPGVVERARARQITSRRT